jgi:hypothetical protein
MKANEAYHEKCLGFLKTIPPGGCELFRVEGARPAEMSGIRIA